MKQAIYGLIFYIFLMLPPVISISESIMVLHMHMQMPLLIIIGMLFTPYLKGKFPSFFARWNENGIPGILLFFIILIYWMILPRAMDDAITNVTVEIFKFISLPFLAGLPLRDSWKKLSKKGKNLALISISIIYSFVAILYIASPNQLCNNYILAEQKALGWTSLFTAIGIIIYYVQSLFIDEEEYE
jgi:hypothetical protein